ncbi:hypothetical protein [Fusibacter ferrireducens]|uniref:ABC transmembrane type-1 domain-containing protein n=1 Tax=Fusibacter ferrireducens TaxID=2785058 RepID=A0ABR9ZMG3_9FIRM|nr:hypothetical protein [Fusibacter ferrireducens]MBF4691657.1 hypothetical protein [Fusibacter ferrireducens]
MLSLILSIFVIIMLMKVLFHIGFGITKLFFSLIGMALFLFFIPVALFFVVPIFAVMAIMFLLKLVF